ncbi:MAG: hypothetical protein ABIT34_00725, partial [Gammaproteobacteria bacterium]
MSQQINLLIQNRERTSTVLPALPALIGLGVMLVVLLGYWGLERFKTVKIQNAAAQGEQRLLAAKADMQTMRQKLASREQSVGLEADIATLKLRSEARQEVLNRVQKGELGSPEGYSRYLTALAKISDNSRWLTSVTISDAGKNVSIAGRALNNEAILRYARE